jgi:hypothetical protein
MGDEVERSIATSSPATPEGDRPARAAHRRARELLELADPAVVGLGFVALALFVYVASNPERQNVFNHFVWQADAFLDGRFAITWPVSTGRHVNYYFQDVMPLPGQPGYGLIPFPPLPAVLLLPLVAIFGLAADAALLAAVVGAVNVGLAWRMLLRVTDDRAVAMLATVFFGFGTVHWYAAMLGSTWFLAHVVATTFLLLAITLALDAERRNAVRASAGRVAGLVGRAIDPMQFAAGLLFGLAGTARLTVLLGAPFFVFAGGGGTIWRRAFSAGLGAVIPFALLLAYNIVSTGHLFHPAYEYLYQTEYSPRPEFIHRDWLIEDPRYIPQNSVIMLAWPPEIRPECGASLLDPACPLLRPDPLGMSLLLTSPAYLLALPALFSAWRLSAWLTRRRLVLAAGLAVLAIALANLMHFSQGWVQFGYRFSNDFAPFALVLVALGIGRLGIRPLTVALVAASVIVNAWGVYWGVTLGW